MSLMKVDGGNYDIIFNEYYDIRAILSYSNNGKTVTAATNRQITGNFFSVVANDQSFDMLAEYNTSIVPYLSSSYRQLRCLYTPRGWHKDFGDIKIVDSNGKLLSDRDFAAVHSDYYQDFLRPTGDSQGPIVSSKCLNGSEVIEQRDETSSLMSNHPLLAKGSGRGGISASRRKKVNNSKKPQKLKSSKQSKSSKKPMPSENLNNSNIVVVADQPLLEK